MVLQWPIDGAEAAGQHNRPRQSGRRGIDGRAERQGPLRGGNVALRHGPFRQWLLRGTPAFCATR